VVRGVTGVPQSTVRFRPRLDQMLTNSPRRRPLSLCSGPSRSRPCRPPDTGRSACHLILIAHRVCVRAHAGSVLYEHVVAGAGPDLLPYADQVVTERRRRLQPALLGPDRGAVAGGSSDHPASPDAGPARHHLDHGVGDSGRPQVVGQLEPAGTVEPSFCVDLGSGDSNPGRRRSLPRRRRRHRRVPWTGDLR
jgi:hypothetical protein